MNNEGVRVWSGPVERLRQRYRQLRGFPWRFFFHHPTAHLYGVMSGPFAGTRLAVLNFWSQVPNLLLGSYELELHPVWDKLIVALTGRMGTGWIIGAAEGYYVCGMARRCPNLRILAFEAEDASRRVLKINLRKNGVEHRVEILGKCDRGMLIDRLRRETPLLIVSDIEGGENHLFNEEVLERLSQTALIIEVHPEYELISSVARLQRSHHVEIIEPRQRVADDYPLQDGSSLLLRNAWLDERRPFRTPWIIAYPRQSEIKAVFR